MSTSFDGLISKVKECGQKTVSVAVAQDSAVLEAVRAAKDRGIANAILHDPELLILDEPTNGLDPIGIAEVRNFIKNLSVDRGKTILISSHILSEIALLADDIGIIDHGVLLEESSMEDLEKKNRKYIQLQVSDVPKASLILERQFHVTDYAVQDEHNLRLYDTALDMAAINKALVIQDVARKLVDGKYVKYMLYPELGEKARNNGHVVYSLDFDVTPHMLRHTYITNLIHASVDPKTVQYLAGHESSKITMDIYAKVKYNKPEQLAGVLSGAFAEWDGGEYEAAQ